ncbi:flagellar hook-basal body protein [Bacillus sp. FJAT-47783]|uniref:flagellar hook-basal body protein n=1 Tax=Bacillus sp. FJAT-47783 TaxID=2922712 RepID=UPI001FAB930A|nr:flagellar hook-basal body protein [Bacillus sp. FJAT-47783]
MLLRSMITATNTMNQLQKQIDTIGHNMANLDTNGYKKTSTSFQELVKQQLNNQPDKEKEIGRQTDFGIRQGTGAKLSTKTVYEQGSIKRTDRELDIAFTKPNQFLQVDVNGEIRYTRDGALYLSPMNDGTLMLVTSDGHPVVDENQHPITFRDDVKGFSISPNGTITAIPRKEGDEPQVAELGVVQMNRPDLLVALGNNMYGFTQANPAYITYLEGNARTEINVQQGALESSNVQLTTEMTDLLVAQRSYQMNAQSITIGDQMLGLINNVR